MNRKMSRKKVSKMSRKRLKKIMSRKRKKLKGGSDVMTSSINSNNTIKVSYTPLGAGGSYGDLYKVTKLTSINDIEINLPPSGTVFKKLKYTPTLKYDYLIQLLKTLELNENLKSYPYLKGIFCLNESTDFSNADSLTSMGFLLGKNLPSFMLLLKPIDSTQFKISNKPNSSNVVKDKYCKDESFNCFFMKQLKSDILKYKKQDLNVIDHKNYNIKNLFTKLITLYKKDLLCLDIKPDNIMYDEIGRLYIIDPDGFFNYNSLTNMDGKITYEQIDKVPITPNLVSFMPSLYIKLDEGEERKDKPLRKINIFLASLYLLMKILLVDIYYNSDEKNLKISLASSKPPQITIFALVTHILQSLNTVSLNSFDYYELFKTIFTPESISLLGQPKIIDSNESKIKKLFEQIIRLNYDEGILNNNTIDERDNAIIRELESLIKAI